MLVVSYAKVLHHIFIRTIYKNFKSVCFFVFFFDLGQTKISKLVWLFHLSNLKHLGSSKVLSLDNILPNGHGLYNAIDHVRIKTATCSHTVF